MSPIKKITVQDAEIAILQRPNQGDYISLTDMVKANDGDDRTNIAIQNWMRKKDTIQYLAVWESLYNPNLNYLEFDAIINRTGVNRFILTPKEWCAKTNAIGVIAKAGRYGGTYAHKDIAYHFGMLKCTR